VIQSQSGCCRISAESSQLQAHRSGARRWLPQLQPLRTTIERNILKDPEYVENVVRVVLTSMQKVGKSNITERTQIWLNPDFKVLFWLAQQTDILALMRSGSCRCPE